MTRPMSPTSTREGRALADAARSVVGTIPIRANVIELVQAQQHCPILAALEMQDHDPSRPSHRRRA